MLMCNYFHSPGEGRGSKEEGVELKQRKGHFWKPVLRWILLEHMECKGGGGEGRRAGFHFVRNPKKTIAALDMTSLGAGVRSGMCPWKVPKCLFPLPFLSADCEYT